MGTPLPKLFGCVLLVLATFASAVRRPSLGHRLDETKPVRIAAISFCTELVKLSQADLPFRGHGRVKYGQTLALRKQLFDAEKVCPEVLAGSLRGGPDWAKKAAQAAQVDGEIHKFGRLQGVFDGSEPPAWKVSWGHVCKNECHELVKGMQEFSHELVTAFHRGTEYLEEACAKHVVREAELGILQSCASACGYNSKVCLKWDSFSNAVKGFWQAQCCSEFNILKGTERANMCDSTLTAGQIRQASRFWYQGQKETPSYGTGVLMGQNRRHPHSWFPVSASAVRFCGDLVHYTVKKSKEIMIHDRLGDIQDPNRHRELQKANLDEKGTQHYYRRHIFQKLKESEKICEEVLVGSLTSGPDWAKKAAQPSEVDGKTHKFGRLQGVVDGSEPPAWSVSLRRVCQDECSELVEGMRTNRSYFVKDVVDGKFGSFEESCADRVVKKVEGHILGCCGDACGWDGQMCALWPFFSIEDKGAWESECCTEFNVLEGTERERMCDSTLTSWQRSHVSGRGQEKKDKGGILIGQDEQLKWTKEGEEEYAESGAKSGQEVSQEFLLDNDISVEDGFRLNLWTNKSRTMESSLLQVEHRRQGDDDCPDPLGQLIKNHKLEKENWFKMPLNSYDEEECGNPTKGSPKKDARECVAFTRVTVETVNCFKISPDCPFDDFENKPVPVTKGTEGGEFMIYLHQKADRCLHVATPSDDKEFDFQSLVFESPLFTFLHAQEFFISHDAACDQPIDFEPPPVPVDVAAKRAQLQQRFVVKHIKESLVSLSKRDVSSAKGMQQLFHRQAGHQQRVPAVELHMFPKNLSDINSTWQVLMVPRAKELFGKKVFLCKNEKDVEMSHVKSTPCVAELSFDPLPPRLLHLVTWSSHSDPLRSTPHFLVLSMEILLLASAILIFWQLLDSLRKLLKIIWELYHAPKDLVERQKLLQGTYPQMYVLTQHAFVHQAPGLESLIQEEPLDACREVQVLEVVEGSREKRGFLAKVEDVLLFQGVMAVWGRIAEPSGWICLENGGDLRVVAKDEVPVAPFSANSRLLVPFSSLLRRQLVLAASHASVQWFLLNTLAKMMGLEFIMAISFGLFIVHIVALYQMEFTHSRALLYEEILENRNKLLQLENGMFTCVASKGFESIRSISPEPALSGQREGWKQVLRLQTACAAVGALTLLMFIVLDAVQMRGELLDYSFNRGYTALPPSSRAVQNTVLLHNNVDALTFTFETGPFTSKVQLRLEHPLMENLSTITIFEANITTGQGGEETVSLPAGPLYSRLLVDAHSHLHEKPTQYMIHFLRVGEAVTLSLNANINPVHFPEKAEPVEFHEKRRLMHQRRNPEWYVPDLDMQVNSTFRVEYLPVIFAPLLAHGTTSNFKSVSRFASECQCGVDEPGFGNSCVLEQPVILPTGEKLCLFQHGMMEQLLLEEKAGSIASNRSKLLEWLVDVVFSGKSAGLQLHNGTQSSSTLWPLEGKTLAKVSNRFKIANIFETSMPTDVLPQTTQLVITPIPDMTDTELLAVPVKLVSHPPPIRLSMNSSNNSFFLPDPMSNERAEYAACHLKSLTQVDGEILDSRFMVSSKEVSKGKDCSNIGTAVMQKEFTAIRKMNKSCDPYCPFYLPWADTHDVSVTFSIPTCLDQAIDMDNVIAFRKILELSSEHYSAKIFAGCGTLQRAVERNRTRIVSQILSSPEVNANGSSADQETPLQLHWYSLVHSSFELSDCRSEISVGTWKQSELPLFA
eukprot:symbB.v1.2.028905.t1/scaffold3109.1/size64052/4